MSRRSFLKYSMNNMERTGYGRISAGLGCWCSIEQFNSESATIFNVYQILHEEIIGEKLRNVE